MVDTETSDKEKGLLQKIKDILVKDGDENSPHLLFDRMNKNMLGGDENTAAKESKPVTENKKPADSQEKRFERLVWGDEE